MLWGRGDPVPPARSPAAAPGRGVRLEAILARAGPSRRRMRWTACAAVAQLRLRPTRARAVCCDRRDGGARRRPPLTQECRRKPTRRALTPPPTTCGWPPGAASTAALESYLVTASEHEMNAHLCRASSRRRPDLVSAVVAAIGARWAAPRRRARAGARDAGRGRSTERVVGLEAEPGPAVASWDGHRIYCVRDLARGCSRRRSRRSSAARRPARA